MLIDELNALERNKHIGGIILVSILMIMGVFGNSHVLLAYSIKVKQTPRTIFILVLGTLDLLTSCIGMPLAIFYLCNPLTFDIPIVCKAQKFVNYFMGCSSSFILLVVAIDRYRRICLPTSGQITKSTAKFLCFGVVVVSGLFTWPTAILYGSTCRTTHQSNITGTSCLILQEYQDTIYPSVFYAVLFVLSCVASTCFVVLYCLIGKTIAEFRKVRKDLLKISHVKVSGTPGRIYTLQKPDGLSKLENEKEVPKVSIIACSNICNSSTHLSNVSSNLESIEPTSCSEDAHGKTKQQNDTRTTKLNFGKQTVERKEVTTENRRHFYNKCIVNDYSNVERTSVGEINIMNSSLTYTNKKDDNKDKLGVESFTKIRKGTNEIDAIENMCSEGVGNIISTSGPNAPNAISQIDTGLGNTEASQPVRRNYTKAHRTTFMFCLIITLFIISYIPQIVLRLLDLRVTGFMESMSDAELFTHNTFVWTYYINNIVNPIIYWFFGEEFRQKLKTFY